MDNLCLGLGTKLELLFLWALTTVYCMAFLGCLKNGEKDLGLQGL